MEGLSLLNLLVQGGSFALLSYLIVYGLPRLHVRISEDATAERKDFMKTLNDLTAVFRSESTAERLACEKHFETLANAMAKGNEATMQAVRTMAQQIQSHAARNQQWSDMLAAEVRKTETANAALRGDSR